MAEGVKGVAYVYFPDESNIPLVKELYDYQTKLRGYPEPYSTYNTGGRVFYLAVEGLRLAPERVGYDKLDNYAINAALDSIKNYQRNLNRPITFTPTDHRGPNTIRMFEIQKGKIVPITDWIVAPQFVPPAK